MKTIFLTKHVGDFNDGSGPMVDDAAFSKREDADAYIDTKEGVMGCRWKWSKETYGHWKVEAITVFDSLEEAKKASEK